jgi:type III secretory pathway component EscT
VLAVAPMGLAESVDHALHAGGIDIGAVGLAWARVMPALVLVPAFGLKTLPLPVRGALGFMLALIIFPGIDAGLPTELPWALALLGETLRGLPIAIAASVPLWAATMTGGLADQLRGSSETVNSPVALGQTTTLGNLFALLASALFLASGGATRVTLALRKAPIEANALLRIAQDLTSGIEIAIAVGAPLIAAAIILELGSALITRAATPAQVQALTGPIKALGILFILAFSIDSMAWMLLRFGPV